MMTPEEVARQGIADKADEFSRQCHAARADAEKYRADLRAAEHKAEEMYAATVALVRVLEAQGGEAQWDADGELVSFGSGLLHHYADPRFNSGSVVS